VKQQAFLHLHRFV